MRRVLWTFVVAAVFGLIQNPVGEVFAESQPAALSVTKNSPVGGKVVFVKATEDGNKQTWRWTLTPHNAEAFDLWAGWRQFKGQEADKCEIWGRARPFTGGAEPSKDLKTQSQDIEIVLEKGKGEIRLIQRQIGPAGESKEEKVIPNIPADATFSIRHMNHDTPLVSPYWVTLLSIRVLVWENHNQHAAQSLDFVLGVAPPKSPKDLLTPPGKYWDDRILPVSEKSPFVLYGRVTDQAGHPFPGALVRVATGCGTLMGGGRTLSDWDGNYRLPFVQGVYLPESEGHIGVQAACMFCDAPGWFETNLSRQGNLAMSDTMKRFEEQKWQGAKGCVLPDKPYEVNFTLAPTAKLEARFLDEKGHPVPEKTVCLRVDAMSPGGAIQQETKTDSEGRFVFENLPTDQPLLISTEQANEGFWTEKFLFSKAGTWEGEIVLSPPKSLKWTRPPKPRIANE